MDFPQEITPQQELVALAAMEFDAMDVGRVFEGDNRLYVQFYPRAVYCPFLSAQEGRPVHEERDFIKIMVPGDKLSNIDTEVTPTYQYRFKRQWEDYKAGRTQKQTGTLLSHWPELGLAQIADLNALHLHTVEQVANLSDTLVGKIPGGLQLRQRAVEYLEFAKGNAVNTQLAEQKAAMQAEIAALRQEIAALTDALTESK